MPVVRRAKTFQGNTYSSSEKNTRVRIGNRGTKATGGRGQEKKKYLNKILDLHLFEWGKNVLPH